MAEDCFAGDLYVSDVGERTFVDHNLTALAVAEIRPRRQGDLR